MFKLKKSPFMLFLPVLLMMGIAFVILNYFFGKIESFYYENLENLIEQQEVIEIIHRVGYEISIIQSRVDTIIDEAAEGNLSMMQIYREHTSIVDKLGEIYEELQNISEKRV